MNANLLKKLAKVGTIVAGTAASFILAACINVKEDDEDLIDGECTVTDSEDASEPADTEEVGS